ncbi:MAG TPA: enoyl-CoA hydratase/isomerase family protein, partial [Myxococcales bacterium]|nr:enoyl-CoA hydratase/isomerase family protein [Myxococcales bacterium]
MTAGCTGSLRGGILYLTLDTRGSSVNVFTPAVALELERELRAGLDRGARAVVLRSAKPGSFVNGVGLLLAASSHAQGAAMERARTLQRCYERLAAAPVPTIAAIEGNCYGCGLELALTCDYRIARDSYDTHFYMPELRDYAFIPLFGGTQRLPLLLGLRKGMEALLGERIGARRASLADRVEHLIEPALLPARLGDLLPDARRVSAAVQGVPVSDPRFRRVSGEREAVT